MTTKTAETIDHKDATSGYAGLDGTTLVPAAELGTGTPDATKVLRGDRTWFAFLLGSFLGKVLLRETEIDFTTPSRQKKFTLSDEQATAGDKIIAFHSGNAATGRSSDENELDALLVRSVCLTNGTITFYVDSLFGPAHGKYKLHYYIG